MKNTTGNRQPRPPPSADNEAANGSGADLPAAARRMRHDAERELVDRLLPFWSRVAVDHRHGGFHGQVDAAGRPLPEAPKSGLLNARILWAFARAHRQHPDGGHLVMARRARDFLLERLWDREHGGLYWAVDHRGEPLETRKQVYLQAFGIYALSEYALAAGDDDALALAVELHNLVERHGHDGRHGGYVEAFARDWSPLADVRVNPRFDLDTPRTMNTHLHLVESYASLARVRPDPRLASRLAALVGLFTDRIFDASTGHCRLYFDEEWRPRSDRISFGHDVEAGWLVVAAARELGDPALQAAARRMALALAETVLAEGVDRDGGVLYEADAGGVTADQKDWWVQAEAVVGFLDAFELGGDERFLRAALGTWAFIRRRVIDPGSGEWRWRVERDGRPAALPLVSRWKCPYHNSRMCVEAMVRLDRLGLGNSALPAGRPAHLSS